jgi:hypothetical protein
MSLPEQKQCERCGNAFECNPANITACQCSSVQLNDQERSFIRKQFDDCLCGKCLNELKQVYYTEQIHAKIKHTPLG